MSTTNIWSVGLLGNRSVFPHSQVLEEVKAAPVETVATVEMFSFRVSTLPTSPA